MSMTLLSFIGIQGASVLTAAMLLHSYRKTHRDRMQMLAALGCVSRASRERGCLLITVAYVLLTAVIGIVSAIFFLPSA